MYVCDLTRALNLNCYENAFKIGAFSRFLRICELPHESICIRWHLDANDCVEQLVFEARLFKSVGSHLKCNLHRPYHSHEVPRKKKVAQC